MSELAIPFRWDTFFRRAIGGFGIVIVWAVRDALRHDLAGVVVALITGIAISVGCYLWTRFNPAL